jgi:ABC-2 type transport system ATP-binding protein
MIELSNLTKKYGSTTALDGVSLSIRPGEVVGLLGPNGAGKTTMLKLITGYIPPSEGAARVADLDVANQSLEVRKRIGYLPETNPLYEDLAVYEALEWTARLRGMAASQIPAAVRRVIDLCGLANAVSKDIGHLSKGYRQRVGLAQAMLHDPEILILDEPTSGLDPNQQQEVRQLIQTLKHKKTVLLSTHILSEAQSSCDRVLIIHRGKIVADGTPEVLSHQSAGNKRLIVELKAPMSAAQQALSQLPNVKQVTVERSGDMQNVFSIETAAEIDIREMLFELAVRQHWPILALSQDALSLEDVFRQLTTGKTS